MIKLDLFTESKNHALWNDKTRPIYNYLKLKI